MPPELQVHQYLMLLPCKLRVVRDNIRWMLYLVQVESKQCLKEDNLQNKINLLSDLTCNLVL